MKTKTVGIFAGREDMDMVEREFFRSLNNDFYVLEGVLVDTYFGWVGSNSVNIAGHNTKGYKYVILAEQYLNSSASGYKLVFTNDDSYYNSLEKKYYESFEE